MPEKGEKTLTHTFTRDTSDSLDPPLSDHIVAVSVHTKTSPCLSSVYLQQLIFKSNRLSQIIFSRIGQEYPFLQVSEIFLSRPAISA